jgi:hypothetical protein
MMYPDVQEVASFLAASGFEVPQTVPAGWQRVIDVSREIVEKQTGYSPFTATQAVRSFSVKRSSFIDLGNGLLDCQEVKLDHRVLEPAQYILHPSYGRSEAIELKVLGSRLVITGVWGFAPSPPASVVEAVLRRAAATLAEGLNHRSSALKKLRHGEVEFAFHEAEALPKQWLEQSTQLVRHLRRRSLA